MTTPQDRVIKKMIDNIVEGNKPHFTHDEHEEELVRSAPSRPPAEESVVIERKIEYGFATMQRDNAEIRKVLTELTGAVRMIKNDIDTLRNSLRQQPREQPAQKPAEQPASSSEGSTTVGAPQYKKTEADEAYERSQGGNSQNDPVPPNQHAARGSQKDGVDLGKVFYYGKK